MSLVPTPSTITAYRVQTTLKALAGSPLTDTVIPASTIVWETGGHSGEVATEGRDFGAEGEAFKDGDILAAVERLLIIQALETTDGNICQAARFLGIGRDKLRYKIKQHNLQTLRSSLGGADGHTKPERKA